MTDKPIPLWQKLTALGIYLALAAAVIVFRSRLGADLWPPDAARVAPNILAAVIQAAVLFPFLVLIWPPTRRRIHRFVDRKLETVHVKVDALHARHDAHHEHLDAIMEQLEALHAKLDGREE